MRQRSAAQTFLRRKEVEPIRAAPKSAYSIACAIDEALKCKEVGESKTIASNISGHGFMDMQGYREVLGLP
jgi:tryptophan synthase beta chain